MTVSMYQISVPIFVQFLTALSGVLDNAAAHAEANRITAYDILRHSGVPLGKSDFMGKLVSL